MGLKKQKNCMKKNFFSTLFFVFLGTFSFFRLLAFLVPFSFYQANLTFFRPFSSFRPNYSEQSINIAQEITSNQFKGRRSINDLKNYFYLILNSKIYFNSIVYSIFNIISNSIFKIFSILHFYYLSIFIFNIF